MAEYVLLQTQSNQPRNALSVTNLYHDSGGIEVVFDEENLVANASLFLVSAFASKLGLAKVISEKIDLSGRVGGANPARKSLTFFHAMVVEASHIDYVVRLRAWTSTKVVPFHLVRPPNP